MSCRSVRTLHQKRPNVTCVSKATVALSRSHLGQIAKRVSVVLSPQYWQNTAELPKTQPHSSRLTGPLRCSVMHRAIFTARMCYAPASATMLRFGCGPFSLTLVFVFSRFSCISWCRDSNGDVTAPSCSGAWCRWRVYRTPKFPDSEMFLRLDLQGERLVWNQGKYSTWCLNANFAVTCLFASRGT